MDSPSRPDRTTDPAIGSLTPDLVLESDRGASTQLSDVQGLRPAVSFQSQHGGSARGEDMSRRDFLAASLAATVVLSLTPGQAHAGQAVTALPTAAAGTSTIKLRLNGEECTLLLDSRVTLLDAIREYAGLSGTKKGCDHGQCGACTVLVGGRRILSCLTLAAMHQGEEITTIEGLAHGDELSPMQAAFLELDGFQCGYCTPGQIMSATALLQEPCGPDDADVRECMSGNLCRCGAYPNIVAAVQKVRRARS
jgi:xanthine dehydrogenase YagT iron-sulfur-binding subunit